MSNLETSLEWSTVRLDAVESFKGQTPRAEDEAIIIDAFEQQPQLVQRAIVEIAEALSSGRISWAWAALRARLELRTKALRDASVDVSTERSRRVRAAEQWLENAGVHYDRQQHVEVELFGDPELGTSGLLDDYADDEALVERMLTRWHEIRPRGERAEQEHETYMRTCAANRTATAQRVDELKRRTLDELAHPTDT